jgi:hypothetical protein
MEPLPPPSATLDNIQVIRAADLAPIRVGAFTAGPGRPTEMDRFVVARAGVQHAPGGSFAGYLGETLATELKAGGRFDGSSGLVVSGVVTEAYLDSAMPTARAALAAHFVATRNGAAVFDKTLRVESDWSSDLVGAVAIPDAFNHYVGLFPKLVNALLSDPEFRRAMHA